MKKFKKNQTVYCLYLCITKEYTSFKIDKGKFLRKSNDKFLNDYYRVMNSEEDIDLLLIDDIFSTELEVEKHLIKIIKEKHNRIG